MTIQSRVPWDDYAALPGVSITRLKELKRSPQHYRHRLSCPKDTQPLTLGKAAHCAVLEPERFATDFAVWERRTSADRMAPRSGKAWDEFEALHSARTIITADEYADVKAIQAAVRGNPDAMRYLETGDPEVTMQWTIHGRACKGRADWLTVVDGQPVLVGLKTARDCRHYQFGSQAAKLGYHLQWGFYHDGYEFITNKQPKVVEIVVENEAPHAVAVYFIPDDIIQQGRDEYLLLLEQLARCEADNDWHGPVVGEQHLTLPSWVYETDDDLSELGLEA